MEGLGIRDHNQRMGKRGGKGFLYWGRSYAKESALKKTFSAICSSGGGKGIFLEHKTSAKGGNGGGTAITGIEKGR